MSDDNPEVEYEKEEGYVRLNLRRPVNFYVPSSLAEDYDPAADSEDPPATLRLNWVYGYRGKDCRSNLLELSSGELVYFTAAVAVIYDPGSNSQRHFTGHTDDVKCIAVHPEKKIVATGQIKGREDNLPHVCVWDSESLEISAKIGEDTFNRGVAAVAFSRDGQILAAVDDSPEPVLTLWKWEENEKIFEGKAASELVIAVSFTQESPSRIVTSGKNHLAFWTYDESGSADKDMALFGDFPKPKYVTSVCHLASGNVVTGDTNGNLLMWENGGRTVERALSKSHKGAIYNLVANDDGTLISSASDSKIVFYDEELNPTGAVIEIPEELGSGRVVLKIGEDLFVGTTYNGIFKTNMDSEIQEITQGHMDEVWGMATSPTEPIFVVAGQDGRIFCRNIESNELLWKKELETGCQSAAISPCGTVCVVGCEKGKWIAFSKDSPDEVIHEGEDGDEEIQVIRFSPDMSKLALGSRDNSIYIYDIDTEEKTLTKRGECEGHSSFVTHLDWSKDSQMLRTNSGDYEILFWNSEDCSQVTDSDEYKDLEWASNNCILSFESLGIWPPGVDGTHVNGCNRAHEKSLLASGDDHGILKLFSYPASVQNAKHHSYPGHSSHVTNVAFSADDGCLLSCGGRDFTVMKWTVEE